MGKIIVIVVLVVLTIGFVFRISCIINRKKYYEEVGIGLSKLAIEIDLKNKEFFYDLLHYVNTANQDKIAIVDFKRCATNMVKNYQKRDKLTDEIATRVLDVIYHHWVERLWSLYFVDKKIIDSKMIV